MQIVLFIFLLLFSNSYADSIIDHEIAKSRKCTILFPYFEQKFKIPHNTLHSISLQESAKKHSIHNISIVWPWIATVEVQGHYFNNKEEAVLFVKKQVAKGKDNIDVGCMQINLRHHPDAFHSLAQAFDPRQNIAYGAKFLRSKYDKLGCWYKAIANYHSATHSLGFKYKQAVVKIANNMDIYKNVLNIYSSPNTISTVDSRSDFIKQHKHKINEITANNKYGKTKPFTYRDRKYKSNLMVSVPKHY